MLKTLWKNGILLNAVVLVVTILPTVLCHLVSDEDLACGHIDCSQERKRFICGTDGRTYSSRCELLRKACEGSSVQVKHKGKCSDDTPCRTDRTQAQITARSSRTPGGVLIPECKEDGSYAEVQCYTSTGYCWCVTNAGKPIPGTTVKNNRPNCAQIGKEKGRSSEHGGNSGNKRRSSNHRGRKERKGCSQNDRTTFNENLLKLFLSDFNRLPSPVVTTTKALSLLDTPEKRAIEWKFSELDRNGDHNLDKKELQALRRMLKKVVKPRPCARTFSRACDQDQDRRISRSEWSLCLGVDMNNEQTEQADKEERQGEREAQGPWTRQITTLSTHVRPTDTNMMTLDEDAPSDCATERQNALDEHGKTEGKFFIPECTADGKYLKVQCFKPTGLCWCVDPESGKTVKGTSVSNMKPDCNRMFRPDKPIKGCPDRKKQQFLNELIDAFVKELTFNNQSSDHSSNIATDVENGPEKAAQRKFKFLDANSNQVIDKKEWKAFKNEVKKKKTMRKCGRNFLRYCDDNDDKRVSEEEWVACLGLKEQKNVSPATKRRGKNPLDLYLRPN